MKSTDIDERDRSLFDSIQYTNYSPLQKTETGDSQIYHP